MIGLTVGLFVAYLIATATMVTVLAMPWPRDRQGFRRYEKLFTASQVAFAATGTLATIVMAWQP